MQLPPKLKAIIVIGILILVMLLPVSYGLLRQYKIKHTEAATTTPEPQPAVNK